MATSSDKAGQGSRKPRVNLKDLKKLIDMMRKAELSEVNIEQEGIKIALKRGSGDVPQLAFSVPTAASPVYAPAQAAFPASAAPSSAPVQAPAPAAPVEEGLQIHSPMVGTFYRASSPDSAPYAEVGTRVEVGQTVCIIEAMKLMNEIKSECAGVVTKVLAENAQPVEFGQPLFVVKP
jgi:acetyl-CoA carboxylase biotin carboxyl carrier protein